MEPTPRVISPGTRPGPAFPAWAALAFLTGGATAMALGHVRWEYLNARWSAIAVAAVGAIRLGAWLELSLYVRLAGRGPVARLAGAVLAPCAAVLAAGVLATRATPLTYADDGGALVFSLVLGLVWAANASLGSLVVLVLDMTISRLVADFRTRILLASMSLVVLFSGLVYAAAQELPQLTRFFELEESELPRRLAGVPLLAIQLRHLWALPHVRASVLLGVGLCALPALYSACAKLAEAVMERVHPLVRAVNAVAGGELDVRVEEGGSREFRTLNASFNQMVSSLSHAQRMEHTFGLYVSRHVAGLIRAQHGEATIPANVREATVLFADIRGFTGISEKLEPRQVLDVLNRYFERIVPVIESSAGYLDKFVGDAVMVVFNGPIDQPDHPERAARCALALQEEVKRLNATGAFPELGALQIGIGVATGPLVTGTLGSTGQMEYTVIGDTVNVASRLTSRTPPGEVWVSEGTARALPPGIHCVELPSLRLKGKEQRVVAFRVDGEPVAADETTEQQPLVA